MMKKFVTLCALTLVLPALAVRAEGTPAAAAKSAQEMSVTAKSPEALAHFKAGLTLFSNVRPQDAGVEFNKALTADPDFALAHLYLGMVTPGSAGNKSIERAEALSAKLSEAERTFIQAVAADNRGEFEKYCQLLTRVTELAPGDWRAQLTLGQAQSRARRWAESTAALERATTLNPQAGTAFNTLGYAYLAQDKNDQAVEAFKKYVQLTPGEPNPLDSLAEAQLRAGKIEESEASFKQALEITPSFAIAWQGVAQTQALRGDWKGCYESMAKCKAASTRASDKLDADSALAWYQFAEGKTAAAMATLDGIEKAAQTEKLDAAHAFVALDRAMMLVETGKFTEAVTQAQTALARGEKAALPGSELKPLRRESLSAQAVAHARMNKLDEAKKNVQLLEAEVAKSPGVADAQSLLHYTQGEIALASGDAKAAVTSFNGCFSQDSYCRWRQVAAMDKASMPSQSNRDMLVKADLRDPSYVYVRGQASKAVAGPAAPAKTGK